MPPGTGTRQTGPPSVSGIQYMSIFATIASHCVYFKMNQFEVRLAEIVRGIMRICMTAQAGTTGSLPLSPPLSPSLPCTNADGDGAHLVCKVGVRHGAAPLQVAGDAAGLEAVAEPGAGDLLGVGRPVAGAHRLVQPLLQLRLQLTRRETGGKKKH